MPDTSWTAARTAAYETEHRLTSRVVNDRVNNKPKSLLRWLQDGYALDHTAKLHSGAVLEEDGDPAMTGEAKAFLGLSYPSKGQDQDQPIDWRKVACQRDEDGSYRWPMKSAIARLRDPWRRRFLAELATELFDPESVALANGIPAWCAHDVIDASLEMVWRSWRHAPMPKRSSPSESQANADAAA